VQLEFAKTETVVPVCAVPTTLGVVLEFGEAGFVDVTAGAGGLTTVKEDVTVQLPAVSLTAYAPAVTAGTVNVGATVPSAATVVVPPVSVNGDPPNVTVAVFPGSKPLAEIKTPGVPTPACAGDSVALVVPICAVALPAPVDVQ
jgi:hypothetical protein